MYVSWIVSRLSPVRPIMKHPKTFMSSFLAFSAKALDCSRVIPFLIWFKTSWFPDSYPQTSSLHPASFIFCIVSNLRSTLVLQLHTGLRPLLMISSQKSMTLFWSTVNVSSSMKISLISGISFNMYSNSSARSSTLLVLYILPPIVEG